MWRDYIENLKNELLNKKVEYNGQIYKIALIDYNGIVHIDLPSTYNKTTAVYTPSEAKAHLV